MPIAPPWVSRLFYAAAVVNWALSLVALVAPLAAIDLLGIDPPRYLFLVRIWGGTAFLFGFVFWEIAPHPVERATLVKYAWLQKSVVALAATLGLLGGDVPAPLFGVVVLTDWIWIPPFVYSDYLLRSED